MIHEKQQHEVTSPETWRKFLEWCAKGRWEYYASKESLLAEFYTPSFPDMGPIELSIAFCKFLDELHIKYTPAKDVPNLQDDIVMKTIMSHYVTRIPRYQPNNKKANNAYCKYCYDTHHDWSEFTDVFPGDVVWECQRCNHCTKDEYMQIKDVDASEQQQAFRHREKQKSPCKLLPEDIAMYHEIKKQKKGN